MRPPLACTGFDRALAAVSMLVEDYEARLQEYSAGSGGEVTFALRLPEDPWQRRVIGHRARVRGNQIISGRIRAHLEESRELAGRVQAFLDLHLPVA